jgi:hypothetical protein
MAGATHWNDNDRRAIEKALEAALACWSRP